MKTLEKRISDLQEFFNNSNKNLLAHQGVDYECHGLGDIHNILDYDSMFHSLQYTAIGNQPDDSGIELLILKPSKCYKLIQERDMGEAEEHAYDFIAFLAALFLTQEDMEWRILYSTNTLFIMESGRDQSVFTIKLADEQIYITNIIGGQG